MISFLEYITEAIPPPSKRVYDGYDASDLKTHKHEYQLGNHTMSVSYSPEHRYHYPPHNGPGLGLGNYKRVPTGHYSVSLDIDGNMDRKYNKPKDLKTHLQIYHALKHSMQEFRKDVPDHRGVHFVGYTRHLQKHYQKMAPKLAKALGSEYHRDRGDTTMHIYHGPNEYKKKA